MMQNQRLLRSISDVAWGEFVRQLEYKCAWGIEVAWSRPLSSFPQPECAVATDILISRSYCLKESFAVKNVLWNVIEMSMQQRT